MSTSCCVLKCPYANQHRILLHKFPIEDTANLDVVAIWAQRTMNPQVYSLVKDLGNREQIQKLSQFRVCDAHFAPETKLIASGQRDRLKSRSVPTLTLPTSLPKKFLKSFRWPVPAFPPQFANASELPNLAVESNTNFQPVIQIIPPQTIVDDIAVTNNGIILKKVNIEDVPPNIALQVKSKNYEVIQEGPTLNKHEITASELSILQKLIQENDKSTPNKRPFVSASQDGIICFENNDKTLDNNVDSTKHTQDVPNTTIHNTSSNKRRQILQNPSIAKRKASNIQQHKNLFKSVVTVAAAPKPPYDEFTAYGEYVASKIRNLGTKHLQLKVQHLLNTAIFELDMKKFLKKNKKPLATTATTLLSDEETFHTEETDQVNNTNLHYTSVANEGHEFNHQTHL